MVLILGLVDFMNSMIFGCFSTLSPPPNLSFLRLAELGVTFGQCTAFWRTLSLGERLTPVGLGGSLGRAGRLGSNLAGEPFVRSMDAGRLRIGSEGDRLLVLDLMGELGPERASLWVTSVSSSLMSSIKSLHVEAPSVKSDEHDFDRVDILLLVSEAPPCDLSLKRSGIPS